MTDTGKQWKGGGKVCHLENGNVHDENQLNLAQPGQTKRNPGKPSPSRNNHGLAR
jgi:hypothetical protein